MKMQNTQGHGLTTANWTYSNKTHYHRET